MFINLRKDKKIKRKKEIKEFLLVNINLLDQIADESSATGWPSERERIDEGRHDEETFVLVLRLASTYLHRVVRTTHPRNLPIPELLYFLLSPWKNIEWNKEKESLRFLKHRIFFSFFLLLLLIPSLLIVTYNIAKYIPLRIPPIFHPDFIHRKYYTDRFKINSMKFNFELNFLKCFDLFSNGKNLTRERHAIL